MSSASGGGETIHLSFGPAANAVTSHLCNLQGLACTSASDEKDPLCDPYITHGIHKETWTPRVLFVDGSNGFTQWAGRFTSNDGKDSSVDTKNVTSWSGPLDIIDQSQQSYHSSTETLGRVTGMGENVSLNSNDSEYFNVNIFSTPSASTSQADEYRNPLQNFQSISSLLASTSASSQYSRYNTSRYKSNSAFMYSSHNRESTLATHNGRHMVWDDEEEEQEEEQDLYDSGEEYQTRKQEKERQFWARQEEDLHDQLHHAWDTFVGVDSTGEAVRTTQKDQSQTEENETKASSESLTTKSSNLSLLQWTDYFMPPHPFDDWYMAPLPFPFSVTPSTDKSTSAAAMPSSQSIFQSYYCGHNSTASSICLDHQTSNFNSEWRVNILSEKIRKYLESCDRICGFQLLVDDDWNFFGGLAHSVLEELHEECPSAVKLSTLVQDGKTFFCDDGVRSETNTEDQSLYWRTENKVVESFRSHLNDGLTLHGVAEYSDLILPISLSQCWDSIIRSRQSEPTDDNAEITGDKAKSLFEAASIAALAMENATLPYRLVKSSSSSSSPQSTIGVNSGFFHGSGQMAMNDTYPTADSLSYHEFVSILRPSNQHLLLEMSGIVQAPFGENGMDETRGNLELYQRLKQGSSIERREFEEERNRQTSPWFRRTRPRDIDPGLWMEDYGPNGGVMSPFSPMNNSANTMRSSHKHFALSTCIRPSILPAKDPLSIYTTLLMEGMGIRYRPERSISTVVKQSFSDMVNHRSFGAGCYWNSILGMKKGCLSVPVITELGNTTRSYYYLNSASSNLKAALSRKFMGYMSRDVMAGMCPETEDCTEALEKCMDFRDVYEPMCEDEIGEGVYFDDNED